MMKAHRPSGFTLIEVLVVLIIISIVAAVIVVTVGHERQSNLRFFMSQLTDSLNAAQEYAVLYDRTVQARVSANDIRYWQQGEGKADAAEWKAIPQELLSSFVIPRTIHAQLVLPDSEQKEQEDTETVNAITMFMNGDWTPFTIVVGLRGGLSQYRFEGLAGGGYRVREVEESSS